MLEETFITLASTYSHDANAIDVCWHEIEQHYQSPSRHYHSVHHLENLLIELTAIKPLIKDWNTVLFSLFYHDVVYDVLKNDNEEQSAAFAVDRLKVLKVPKEIIAACEKQILATKQHLLSDDNDTNLFTDADLGVLGQSWEVYDQYSKNVRLEYAIHPDEIYKPGRKKVLEHFINMERIYKTAYFYDRLEQQAKENLGNEWRMLNAAINTL